MNRSYNSQALTGRITLHANEPLVVTHNFGSQHYHIHFKEETRPVQLEVTEQAATYFVVEAAVSGNYFYSITRAPDSRTKMLFDS